MFGTALLYGDGLITPAISVLSAVEGFEVATSAFADWVIPVSVVILVVLFSVQSRGTAGIARVFGPVMVVWFAVIGVLGLRQIVDHPGVLEAVWPGYAVEFFADEPGKAFLSLGSIFLVVTGGEALYADMGHFGRRPIQLSWYTWVFPALRAQLLRPGGTAVGGPGGDREPVLPLGAGVGDHAVGRAGDDGDGDRLAGVDLRRLLADLPGDPARLHPPSRRCATRRATHVGQIYVPLVNWLLMIGCVGLVIGFRSSSALGVGLRHRRHGDDGDHHAAVLPGRRRRASVGR